MVTIFSCGESAFAGSCPAVSAVSQLRKPTLNAEISPEDLVSYRVSQTPSISCPIPSMTKARRYSRFLIEYDCLTLLPSRRSRLNARARLTPVRRTAGNGQVFINIAYLHSAKLLWKINAVSNVKPAVKSAVVRVSKPRSRSARPPLKSQAVW